MKKYRISFDIYTADSADPSKEADRIIKDVIERYRNISSVITTKQLRWKKK